MQRKVIYLVNMLNFRVKLFIDNSSIKYLPLYILHNWMFEKKTWTKNVLGLDDMMMYKEFRCKSL